MRAVLFLTSQPRTIRADGVTVQGDSTSNVHLGGERESLDCDRKWPSGRKIPSRGRPQPRRPHGKGPGQLPLAGCGVRASEARGEREAGPLQSCAATWEADGGFANGSLAALRKQPRTPAAARRPIEVALEGRRLCVSPAWGSRLITQRKAQMPDAVASSYGHGGDRLHQRGGADGGGRPCGSGQTALCSKLASASVRSASAAGEPRARKENVGNEANALPAHSGTVFFFSLFFPP